MLNDKVCKEIRGHPIACFVEVQKLRKKTIPVQLHTSQANLQAIIDHANYAWLSVRLYATVFYNGKCSHTCILRIILYFARILAILLLKLRIFTIENINKTRQALNCFSCFIHILNCKTSVFFGT